MKLLIDLSEKDYETIQKGVTISYALRKGELNVLPKEYGRLIDAEVLFKKVGDIKPRNEEHYKAIGEFMNMITDAEAVLDTNKQMEV